MKHLIILFFSILSIEAFAKTEKWMIDPDHTMIGFEIPHLMMSSVEGQFDKFSGQIMFDAVEKDLKKVFPEMSFNAEIDTASINTGNKKRDNHLRSPDFFNIKKPGHEKISFSSTKVQGNSKKRFKVLGDLTLNGITKPVVIKFMYFGHAKAYGVSRIMLKGKLKIKREDFGLTWNDGKVTATKVTGKILESAGAVGSEVEIKIKIQAKRVIDMEAK